MQAISSWCKRCVDNSIVGVSIQPMISFGAPALTAASRTNLAAAIVDAFALGCGEKIMPLRVFKQISDLKIAVEVGFVVGIIPAITPKGSATILIPFVLSTFITPHVFAFLCFCVCMFTFSWAKVGKTFNMDKTFCANFLF